MQVIPKSVYFLQEPDIDADEEYGLMDMNAIFILITQKKRYTWFPCSSQSYPL